MALRTTGRTESDSTALDVAVDAPFFFGSEFGVVWWEDLKRQHVSSDQIEFDEMVEQALVGASSSSNIDYIRRLQREFVRKKEAQ